MTDPARGAYRLYPNASRGHDGDDRLVLIIIVMAAESFLLLVTVLVNRPQETIEGLRCNVSPLLARRGVCEAEMNPHVDASVDDVVGQI